MSAIPFMTGAAVFLVLGIFSTYQAAWRNRRGMWAMAVIGWLMAVCFLNAWGLAWKGMP